ncbi:polysaccharide deacetylase family protein [Paenibacillus alvei]
MKMLRIFLFLFTILVIPPSVSAQQKVPILIYHSIDEFSGQGSKELYVTPENFEKQIEYLRKAGFTLLTFERWQDISKVNKPIFLTFDDGYKNNWEVYKIFRKLKTEQFQPTATFFVIADFIGRSNRLSKAELKELADSGIISIQSHTATHPDLTNITNYRAELKGSRDTIQTITGKPVIAVAYPYGGFNSSVMEQAKRYYKFGLTTTPAYYANEGLKDGEYLLPRIYIKYTTSLDEFTKIVEGN